MFASATLDFLVKSERLFINIDVHIKLIYTIKAYHP